MHVPIHDDGVGEGIGNVEEPAVCTPAYVAAMNEAAVHDITTALTEAAAVQGNESCWYAY